MPTTNILNLLKIPNLEAVTILSGIALKAAPKHRLLVSDFATLAATLAGVSLGSNLG